MLREVLDNHNIRPRKERGQHFLDDERTVAEMVDEADLAEDETVLEIGAGVGTITRQLAAEAGTVLAYENDPELARVLREETADLDNVDVREEDVLKADVPAFDVCVSNIPFHRSSDILDFLFDRGVKSVLLVQEEFAQRLVAEPGEDAYSKTTVLANYRFLPVYLDTVRRDSFHPRMNVDAALVKLFPRNEAFDVDETFFLEVLNALFVHAKKKARNAFYDSRHMFDLDKEGAKELRDEIPHAQERVRELGVRELVAITQFLEQTRD